MTNDKNSISQNSAAQPTADDYLAIADAGRAEQAAANANVTPAPITISNWPVRSLRDAYVPRPPIKYYVDGIFAESSLNIVYGSPGSKKSMVLADCCICVASGLPWLEPIPNVETKVQPLETTQAPILWVDFDNGLRRTDERFDAMAKVRRLAEDTPIHYTSMPSPWLDASSHAQITELAKLVESLGAKMVVIDNLGLITGSTEENSAEMSTVMGNLRVLAESTKSAVIVIHHQRKSSGASGGRKGDTLRGHSSIEASLDLALLIECPDGSDEITLTPTKVRGPDPRKIGALFTYSHRDGTKELGEARFYGTATEDLTDDNAVDEAVIDIVTEHGEINMTNLLNEAKEATGININKIRARVRRLASDNILTLTDNGAGKSKLFSIAKKP